MPKQKLPRTDWITQILPEQRQVRLEGLYLAQNLAALSATMDRPLVITAYISDQNGVVANKDKKGKLQVPPELKNPFDWRLFQELMAQSDVVISGSAYMKRLVEMGSHAEDVLFQFEPGNKFADLGDWRLKSGFQSRHPDLVILTHNPDFHFPPDLLEYGRRIYVFTTNSMAESEKARELTAHGVAVVGCGETGVDGGRLIDYLSTQARNRVIMLATGPGALELLLQSQRLDLLYLTVVQREIRFSNPSDVRMILPGGKRGYEPSGFSLAQCYSQQNVTADDGEPISQEFRRYDRNGFFIA